MAYTKRLHYSKLRNLLEQEENGEKVPFSIAYACMNGGLVDVQEQCMVCIGVDTKHHRRTIKSLSNPKEIRTIHDVLVLRVNDVKIIVS